MQMREEPENPVLTLLHELAANVDVKFERLAAAQATTDAKVDGLAGKVDRVIAAQAVTDAKVDRLEGKVDHVLERVNDVMAGQVRLMTEVANRDDP